MSDTSWFVVDRKGLAQLLAARGKGFALLELFQNAADEPGVTQVTMTLEPIEGRRGVARLVVEDDAPEGFVNLAHAYTLFADSRKRANPTQRGRYNLGEKLVIALCETATITTTTGGVTFNADGSRQPVPFRQRRARGSRFEAVIRFTREDCRQASAAVRTLLPPSDITLTYNGDVIPSREPVHAFETRLPTVKADAEGNMSPTTRTTTVELFEPAEGEVATLYEMGIPVVELPGDRWHVSVGQKIPLNADRDNVTPAYLRTIRTVVMNHTYGELRPEDATATWAREALGDSRVETAAVEAAMDVMFGSRRVSFDPSDPEANARAVSEGYTVVHGGSLSGDQWRQVRRAEAIRPAGQVYPTPQPQSSPDGEPPVPEEEWTRGMRLVAEYARILGRELLGFQPEVLFYREVRNGFSASWGGRTLSLYMRQLGRRWFEQPDQERVDALLLHEFAHHLSSNHLSHEFHDAICRLGARLRNVQVTLRGVEILMNERSEQ